MNNKRLFFICSLLCLLMSWGGDSVTHAADSWNYPTSKPSNPYAGGSGSKSDPYRISTAQQLANFAYMIHDNGKDYAGNYFILTNDIVLNEGVIKADGTFNEGAASSFKQWTTPGKWRFPFDNEFEGTFDGQNHAVIGLYQDQTAMLQLGLFGMAEGATIKNVRVKDSYIRAREAGFDYENVDQYSVAMVIGYMYKSSISNCHVENSVVHADHGYHTGGVIGMTENSTVAGCSFTKGSIEVFENPKPSAEYSQRQEEERTTFGGVIGYSYFDTSIRNCTSSGTLKCKFGCFGGVIGFFDEFEGLLTECSSTMHIVAVPLPNKHCSLFIGGIAGELSSYHNPEVTKCAYYGNITVEEGDYDFWGQFIVSGLINAASSVRGTGHYPHVFKDCASIGDITFKGKVKSCSNLYINGLSCHCVYKSYDSAYDMVTTAVNCIAYHKVTFTDGQTATHYNYNPLIGYPDYIEDLEFLKISRFNFEDSKNNYYSYKVISGTDPGVSREYGTAKTLEDLKASISTLNAEAGSNVWGQYTNTEDEYYYGIPLPIVCGGDVTGLAGSGTKNAPYLIGTEAELRALQKGIADGTRGTEGLYFKLTNDIYMSSEPMPRMSSKSYPFKGTFDGGGHAIVGMVAQNGTLFEALAGTLQNLALVDFKVPEGQNVIAPLAVFVGGTYTEQEESVTHKGTVKNCYVTGDINMVAKDDGYSPAQARLTGLCMAVYENSTMENCYFKGSFNATYPNPSSTPQEGIIKYDPTIQFGGCVSSVYGTVKNCYASYTLSVDDNFTNKTIKGVGSTSGSGTITNCYYICPSSVQFYAAAGEKLSSESELNDKFNGVSGWSQGLYRPVLTSVKSYAATLPNNGGTKYIDAVPEATPTSNYIVNVKTDGNPYYDRLVWQLPNVAVYVPSENADFILNCTLNQSADFKYNRTEGATRTVGQLCYTLQQNASGYHMLCLPGVVERGDLPKNSKVMIYGKIMGTSSSQEINEVHVDTIPAGVPCILYVPTTAYAEGSEIPLVMRSEIRTAPLLDANYSNMQGTFSTLANVSDACVTAGKHEDGNVYFEKSTSAVTMQPFTAWLEGATGENVQIVDYVLLDEENEAMTLTLVGLHSTVDAKKETNVKLRRTIKAGKWNTVCLPFDMTAKEIKATFGEGTKVEAFNGLEYDSNTSTTTLKFATATAADGSTAVIKAGVPYLLKPGKTTDANIFELKAKEIQCASETNVPSGQTNNATVEGSQVSLTMQGNYNKRVLTPETAADKKLYILSGDKIYLVDSDVVMKGFRCYFSAPEVSAGGLFSKAMVMHGDGSTTAIRLVETGKANGKGVYDLLGRPRDAKDKDILIKGGKKVVNK